jgi:hypothetical protein
MVRLEQTVHISCTCTNTITKWTETRFDMTHVTLGVLLGASKVIAEAMVRLA